MQDKPNSLPWKLIKTDDEHYTVWSHADGRPGYSIFHNEMYENQSPEEDEARYIVQCVNSHQALVDALKYALESFEYEVPSGNDAIAKIRAALLLAGGESE